MTKLSSSPVLMKSSGLAALFFAAISVAVAASSVLAAQEAKKLEASKEPRQKLFVITDQEGYGTEDCLGKESACGKIIADSFCESNGFKVADFYRKADADDVTGSIASERKPAPRKPQAFVISCK